MDFMIPSSRLLPLGVKVLGLAGIAAIIFSAYASSVDIQSSYAQSQLLGEPATTIEPVTATNNTTTALAQSNASSEIALEGDRITSTSDGNQSIMDLDAARQQYLSVWENTPFSSQFDVFIEEGSSLGYGVYREHLPANIFRPGETIVLYVEPVGFGHQPIINPAVGSTGSSNVTTLYLINMTADYIISDSTGFELQRVEDLPVGELISHRQNLEMFLTLTLSQEQPFPIGDYILTYVVHDQVTGQSFQIEKRITIDNDAGVSSSSTPTLPSEEEGNSAQPVTP